MTDMATYANSAQLIILLLVAALLVGIMAGKMKIPYAVALVAIALPFHPDRAIVFAPSVLIVFLPALIFEAAWQINLPHLKKHWLPVAVLAIPGVAITAFVIATGLWFAHVMPFLEALLIGAILSATDPIAVIATFKQLEAPPELATIIEGESLCNDGVAAVLYTAILAIIVNGSGQLSQITLGAFGGSIAGIVLGCLIASITAFAMRYTKEIQLQILATLVAAYSAYLIAIHFHASGIFAALAAGIALRAYKGFPSTPEVTGEIDRFWGVLAFLSNAIVFLLLGLRIDCGRILHEPVLVGLTILLTFGSRALFTYIGLPLLGIHQRGWNHIAMLAGIRGALSLALALILPIDIPDRPQIIDAVFGVVTVSLLLQGLTIGPVMRILKIGPVASEAS
jgi:CPA1 family monovalent cation:H+ antiporter